MACVTGHLKHATCTVRKILHRRHKIIPDRACALFNFMKPISYQNVQRYCRAILEINSDEPWANYHMGKALETENPLKALEHFKKAVEKEPNEPKFYADLIILLLMQKQYVESLSYIDEAIEHLPHEPSFYMSRGLAFTSFKMPEYANICYKNADKHAIDYVKMFPEDVHGCDDLLHQLQVYGRDDAITECRIIIDEYWKKQQHVN